MATIASAMSVSGEMSKSRVQKICDRSNVIDLKTRGCASLKRTSDNQ